MPVFLMVASAIQSVFMQLILNVGAGAMQLMSMQEDLQRQVQTGELGEHAVEAYLETKQQEMLDNLWKLNVADIELTLAHVCQKVFITLNHFCSEVDGS